MKRILFITFLALVGIANLNLLKGAASFLHNYFAGAPIALPTETVAPNSQEENVAIQVALLLDTSGSMSGLIEQTKSQLWNILNELARTEKNGTDTKIEIALYEYGNPSKTKNSNEINLLAPFTTDMDHISEKLFALQTSGGEEYCGAVIKQSLSDLNWTNDDGLRMIYVAGNEAFTQGPVSFELACKKAREKGIIINTIFCGDYDEGVSTKWKDGAAAGLGDYLNINHNAETVYVPTPFDDEISELNKDLNKTYIPYGEKGRSAKENQNLQDSNASSYSKSNAVSRTAFKSSKKYNAAQWDLVDAYKKDKNVLKNAEIHMDSLSALNPEMLENRVQAISKTRTVLQTKIKDLDKRRRAYKAAQANDDKEDSSLQGAVISTVRKQAKRKGFNIKN